MKPPSEIKNSRCHPATAVTDAKYATCQMCFGHMSVLLKDDEGPTETGLVIACGRCHRIRTAAGIREQPNAQAGRGRTAVWRHAIKVGGGCGSQARRSDAGVMVAADFAISGTSRPWEAAAPQRANI